MSESVEVEGAGLKAKATGSNAVNFLLVALLCFWVWFVSATQDSRAAEREVEKAKATKILTDAMEKQVSIVERQTRILEQVERTQKAQIYVLTLPTKEREKLNLIRPEVLYEMQGFPRER